MIRRTFALSVLVMTLVAALPSSAIELGAVFRIGNLAFQRTRAAGDTGFSGMGFPWGGAVYGRQDLTESLAVTTGFYADPILRNTSYTVFTYTESFFTIGVGPYFGFFNSLSTILKPGIRTSVRLDFPGIVFLEFLTESSIGGRLVEAGDYLQEQSIVTFGYYVPHAICSLSLTSKKFTQKTDSGEVIDGFTEYAFATDIYEKNVPYRVVLSFGYQILDKAFLDSTGSKTTHTLNSIVVGTKVTLRVSNAVSLVADVDSAVYTFGTNALLGTTSSNTAPYLFRGETGLVITIDSARP
jgi:hypothetical protein